MKRENFVTTEIDTGRQLDVVVHRKGTADGEVTSVVLVNTGAYGADRMTLSREQAAALLVALEETPGLVKR